MWRWVVVPQQPTSQGLVSLGVMHVSSNIFAQKSSEKEVTGAGWRKPHSLE